MSSPDRRGTGATRSASVQVPPHTAPVEFCASSMSPAARADARRSSDPMPRRHRRARWPQEVTTTVTLSTAKDAYVVDDIALPIDESVAPQRAARRHPVPRRTAPASSSRSTATSGSSAACRQTADRALAAFRLGPARAADARDSRRADLRLRPQRHLAAARHQRRRRGRRARAVLECLRADRRHARVSRARSGSRRTASSSSRRADRRRRRSASTTAACCGSPPTAARRRCSATASVSRSIGVNVRTGLVTASDQQGHYIPTTPLHIVRDRQFYGFLSDKLPREDYPAPIAEPLTWIPHAVNASAMSQVWLFGARMGPLNDALVHIGFNNPELFRVMLNERGATPQAAVVEHHPRVRVPAAQRLGESRPTASSISPASRFSAGARPRRGSPASAACATPARRRRCRAKSCRWTRACCCGSTSRSIAKRAAGSRQLLAHELALQAHLQVRLAAVQGRRHARASIGSRRAAPISRKDGRSVFVGVPGHEAGDADARRLVARDRRRRDVPGQRVLHAVRAGDVRSARRKASAR